MSDREALERRLLAVERALADGDHDVEALRDAGARTERIESLEARVADVEDRVGDLEATSQALRGYVGNVRSVNDDVEQRANAALATVERLEERLGEWAEMPADERKPAEKRPKTAENGRRDPDCERAPDRELVPDQRQPADRQRAGNERRLPDQGRASTSDRPAFRSEPNDGNGSQNARESGEERRDEDRDGDGGLVDRVRNAL